MSANSAASSGPPAMASQSAAIVSSRISCFPVPSTKPRHNADRCAMLVCGCTSAKRIWKAACPKLRVARCELLRRRIPRWIFLAASSCLESWAHSARLTLRSSYSSTGMSANSQATSGPCSTASMMSQKAAACMHVASHPSVNPRHSAAACAAAMLRPCTSQAATENSSSSRPAGAGALEAARRRKRARSNAAKNRRRCAEAPPAPEASPVPEASLAPEASPAPQASPTPESWELRRRASQSRAARCKFGSACSASSGKWQKLTLFFAKDGRVGSRMLLLASRHLPTPPTVLTLAHEPRAVEAPTMERSLNPSLSTSRWPATPARSANMRSTTSAAASAASSGEAALRSHIARQAASEATAGCRKAAVGKSNMPPLAPPVRGTGTTKAPRVAAERASAATPGPPSTAM
mmetsp:Transcript_54546/g.157748  ORF Transcript_54546/g.157748 Transcript_54546/m.157748 type:complete len:408 (+) Transcript_54546:298-1521(+)